MPPDKPRNPEEKKDGDNTLVMPGRPTSPGWNPDGSKPPTDGISKPPVTPGRPAQEPPAPTGKPREVKNAGNGSVRAPMPDEIVVLRDIKKSFGGQEILKGVDLVARRRETTVIIGGSGAGKTTLLRLIVALERATSGHIFVDGEDVTHLSERELNRVRKKFGMVYQYAALLDSISIFDNVAFPLVENTKMAKKEIKERVMNKLEILGLDPKVVAPKFPSELSGGMRKRVGLARALMLEPPILVYDEPTSGLDPLTSRLVDDLIEEMRQRFSVTSIVISHDIASCFRIAHQAVLLIKGRVEANGPPDELLEGGSEVAREFIRNSAVDVEAIGRVSR
jgi:phospholipid/cholesterol/gamma-HCH transport system ATP-binding protein